MAAYIGITPPHLRFLCLHGKGSDGAGLRKAMAETMQHANLPHVDFSYMDAPWEDDVPPVLPMVDADASLAERRCWWRERFNDEFGRWDYEGAEHAVAAVLARLGEESPPFHGLVGEGQGGELAAIVLAMQIRSEFPPGVPKSLRYGWIQNASSPRDAQAGKALKDKDVLRNRPGGVPSILVTAYVRDDASDPRTTGPCHLSERLGSVFAAQYWGEDGSPTCLLPPEDAREDDVTAFVQSFFAPGADDRMRRMCAACGARAKFSCGSCKAARYCSRECQKDHWGLHKDDCAPAAAALAARDAATAAALRKAADDAIGPDLGERPNRSPGEFVRLTDMFEELEREQEAALGMTPPDDAPPVDPKVYEERHPSDDESDGDDGYVVDTFLTQGAEEAKGPVEVEL